MKKPEIPAALRSSALLALFAPGLLCGCAGQPEPMADRPRAAWKEQQVALSQCSLRVRELASDAVDPRPPLVMINGVPVTSLIYAPLAEQLHTRGTVRALLVDLPGTGGSRLRPGVAYNWSSQRACLREWLETLPTYHLVVHDLAGPIALPIVTEANNIAGMILFNTVLRTTQLDPPFPLDWLRHTGPFAKPLAHSLTFPFYAWRLRQIGLYRPDRPGEQFLRELYTEVRAEQGLSALVDIMQGFEVGLATDNAIRDALARDLPRLVIWGEADPVLGREWQYLPVSARQRLELTPAKHFLMLDHSTEIAAWIDVWLRDEWEKRSLSNPEDATRAQALAGANGARGGNWQQRPHR